MNDILVTIIVPVYKAERFLTRCIESVLEQTHTNFQLILIDDGSPDGSGNICDKYAKYDERIKVIHQKNQGVSVARNSGLDATKGEYVCFVDADDYIDKDLIKDNLKIALEQNADIVCFNFFKVRSDIKEKISEYKNGYVDLDVLIPFFKGKSSRCVWNKFYKWSVWKTLRFPVDMPYAEDWYALTHTYMIATKIVVNEKAYYFYNIENDTSLTHVAGLRYLYFDFLVVATQVNLLKNGMEMLMDLALKHAYQVAFKAYHYNMYMHFLKQEQECEIKEFIYDNRKYISKIRFMDKIFLACLLYCPVINKIKGYSSYIRLSKRYKNNI